LKKTREVNPLYVGHVCQSVSCQVIIFYTYLCVQRLCVILLIGVTSVGFIVSSRKQNSLVPKTYYYYYYYYYYYFILFVSLLIFFFFAVALRPNAGHGLLILEVSRSHTTKHHIR